MRKGRFLRPLLAATSGLCLLVVLSWLPGLVQAPSALASSFVIGSDPIDGSTISVPPTQVRIFFNTPVSPASTATIYFGPEYQIMNAGHSYVAINNPRELDTPLLTHLPEGSYTVRWTALSTTDGRSTYGVIGFNIGHSSTGLPGQVILGPSTSNILPELSSLGLLAIAWDWLVMVALAFWIGILVIESINVGTGQALSESSQAGTASSEDMTRTGASPVPTSHVLPISNPTFSLITRVRKQSLPLQWLCLVALGVGEVINLILRAVLYTQTFNTSGIDPTAIRDVILDTTYGHLWVVRMALIGLALVLLGLTSRSVRREPATASNPAIIRTKAKTGYTFVMLTLTGLIVLTLALSEDLTQLAQVRASAVMLVWLFLVAQSIWFGGAAYLGFILLPLLPTLEPELHARSLVMLIKRSTPLIGCSIVVMLVSGLFLIETGLSNAQQLLIDPFGRALLVKILLVAIMLLVTIYALFFLAPQLRRQLSLLHVVNSEMPARRTRQVSLKRNERRLIVLMKSLAYLGAGALLCAAFMSFFAPPIVFPAITYTNGSSTNTQVNQTKLAGDLTVHLQVTPARVASDNTVAVSLKDSNGKPVTDAQVHIDINMVIMDMGTASATVNRGNPTYVAVFKKYEAFSMPGLWNISLNIQRPNQAPVQVSFQVPFQ